MTEKKMYQKYIFFFLVGISQKRHALLLSFPRELC
nr:MAG TPA: hypothetical protein [Caudoviricetes sp.]